MCERFILVLDASETMLPQKRSQSAWDHPRLIIDNVGANLNQHPQTNNHITITIETNHIEILEYVCV